MGTIGERIKRARNSHGLSQAALAQAANVSQPTVANWENGSHAPRPLVLNTLAKIMDSSTHYLLNGDEDENGATLAPTQYLQSAIRHVPIRSWPVISDIQMGSLHPSVSHDYLAISTDAKTPFALTANDPDMAALFPIGATIIFDAAPGTLEDGATYLFLRNGQIILRRWRGTPDRLEALPNHLTVSTNFTSEKPTPLARALISIRRH